MALKIDLHVKGRLSCYVKNDKRSLNLKWGFYYTRLQFCNKKISVLAWF